MATWELMVLLPLQVPSRCFLTRKLLETIFEQQCMHTTRRELFTRACALRNSTDEAFARKPTRRCVTSLPHLTIVLGSFVPLSVVGAELAG